MRRVGDVVGTPQGLVVARSPDGSRPSIGEEVLDSGLDAVGTVVDVIGPVERPFVVVHPTGDRPIAPLVEERLYVR